MTKLGLVAKLIVSSMLLGSWIVGCTITPSVTPSGLTPTPFTRTPIDTAVSTTTLTPSPTATKPPSTTPSATLTPTPTTSPKPSDVPTPTIAAVPPVTLTIVYDNHAYTPGLRADWGFACLIEREATTVLFDTGADGALLLENLSQLGSTPQMIDAVVLSHAHQDHTGGLAALLDAGATPVVYVPATFTTAFKQQVSARVPLVEVEGPSELLPGFTSTGPVGTHIPEQALTVETPAGLVVITGCAHPGVAKLTSVAAMYTHNDSIGLVLGGFHLGSTSATEVETIIDTLQVLNVQRVAPCHCTGARAQTQFAAAYGENYIDVGAGWTLVLNEPPFNGEN